MLCWAAAALLAGPLNLSLGARADGSASSDPVSEATVRNGTLSGAFGLSGLFERALITATYAPTLRFTDQPGAGTSIFNSVTFGASGKSGRLTLTGTGYGSLGQQDFSPVAQSQVTAPGTTPAPPIDRLPATRFVSIGSAGAQVATSYLITSRVQLGAAISASTAGGLTTDAQALLPRQRAGSLSANARWLADPLDTLSGSISSSLGHTAGSSFAAAEQTSSVGGQLAWARRLGPSTSGTLGIGAAVTSNSGGQAPQTSAFPTATASLSHSTPLLRRLLALSFAAAISPQIDPLTGVGYFQGTASSTASYSPRSWLTFNAAASGARALNGPFGGQWGAVGELSAAVKIRQRTSFNIGFREAKVIVSPGVIGGTGQSSLQWSAFAGISTGLQEAF